MQFICFFIDHVAPGALQEALHADNVAGVPWATCIKGASAHFVKSESIGTELVIHFIRSNDVF